MNEPPPSMFNIFTKSAKSAYLHQTRTAQSRPKSKAQTVNQERLALWAIVALLVYLSNSPTIFSAGFRRLLSWLAQWDRLPLD